MCRPSSLRKGIPIVILLTVQLIECATAFFAPSSRGVLLNSAHTVKTWQQPCGELVLDARQASTCRRGRNNAQVLMATQADRRSSLSAILGAGIAAAALPVPAAHADYGQGRYDDLQSTHASAASYFSALFTLVPPPRNTNLH